MEWHPKGDELMLQWLPREQNRLVVYGASAKTGVARVVHEQKDEAYVDVSDDFRWLNGGEMFFWTSDTAFHQGDGKRFRQCGTIGWDTRGEQVPLPFRALTRRLDVIDVVHVPTDNYEGVLFTGRGEQTTQKRLYEVDWKVGQLVAPHARTEGSGWHDYQSSPDGAFAIHTFSRFDEQPVIDIVRLPATGEASTPLHESVRVLVDNAELRERYAAITKGKNEFFTVAIDGRVTLDGWAMYTAHYDAVRSWPVVFHVYGEPWSQTVKDTWFLSHHLFHRWLTQLGYVVMSVDARAVMPGQTS